MEEVSLKNKLNMLQAEMRNFQKKISPVKSQKQPERLVLPHPEKSKLLSTCISILSAFLKFSVCLTGPTIFPTIVYCIEGSSQLFWQVTAVSCAITLLFAMMIVPLLCLGMKRAQAVLGDSLSSSKILLNKFNIFRQLSEVTASDFMRKNINKVLYPLAILFVTSVVTFAAYLKNMYTLFHGSLMLISFVSGILSTQIFNLASDPELLPFRSPCKIKMEYATPSPEPKRELQFSSLKKSNSSPALQLSAPTLSPWYETNLEYIETKSITAFLPELSQQNYKKTIARTQSLQLPFSLNFFRKL